MKIIDIVFALAGRAIGRLERAAASAVIARLKSGGRAIHLGKDVCIEHPECVSIGDHVHLGDHCWISILVENSEAGQLKRPLKPELTIGKNTYIGRFGTLACMDRVRIGESVMISDRVFVGDSFHGFSRTDIPIRDQYMYSPGPVSVGDGTWIGIGVSILPNVSIGKNCVIGANSVVTHDVADFCVAAGNPAKIIRYISSPE